MCEKIDIFGKSVTRDYHYPVDPIDRREFPVTDQDLCTSSTAAKLLGVTPRTVQLWADSGIIPSWKTPGGHRRYSLKDVKLLAEEVQKEQSLPETVGEKRPLRIQVIEDEQSLQRLYARTIGNWKLPVELRQSLDGYRGLLELGRFEPDLLVLDLNLPNIDGFEVIEAIQSQGLLDQLHLLVVTALEVPPVQARIDAIVPGVEVLPKPIPFERIQQTVEQLLEKF